MSRSRDATGVAPTGAESPRRWAAHPVRAAILRTFVFVLPIAVSLGLRLPRQPSSARPDELALRLRRLVDRAQRVGDLRPHGRRPASCDASCRSSPSTSVSLVFPDAAPSRFRTALGKNTAETLEERLAHARATGDDATPVDAATRLLELVSSLDQHDPLTRGHSERVLAYAQLIGKELRLREDELDLLNWAALVHDVGKLEVSRPRSSPPPASRRTRSGRCCATIPRRGEELVAPLGPGSATGRAPSASTTSAGTAPGIRTGSAVRRSPSPTRIVAVADVFDVITSARSYKFASDTVTARQEITNCAGTHSTPSSSARSSASRSGGCASSWARSRGCRTFQRSRAFR